MNYAIQAALMSKASKVFASEDTFLSFPVSPLPFPPHELELHANATADEARQSLQNLQSFSTLVNLLPDDEAWLPSESRFLWDVYRQVLKDADFANSTRTPEEEAAYQQALGFLRSTEANGLWTDSATVQAYRQHKDAWLLAQQRYQAARSTAETASDPGQRLAWSTGEEPALRAELDMLQAQWILEGHKNEVESAQSTVVSLGARSPIQTWAEWNSRFNADLDSLTGASDTSTVYPSFFSPTNALDEAAWRPFKLSASEIAVLLSEAPAELRERLAGASGATSDVSSLAFEFSSALVVRPWFVPEVFRSRFWRFADGGHVISNGGSPAAGDCPAYVTAIVFARKVVEERPPAAPPSSEPFSGFHFLVAVRDAQVRQRITQQVQPRIRPEILAQTAHPVAAQPLMAQPLLAHAMLARPAFAARPALSRSYTSAFTRLAPPPDDSIYVQMDSHWKTRVPTATPVPPPVEAPVEPPVLAPPPDDSIYVLAFICKRVPLCPNPDTTLQW